MLKSKAELRQFLATLQVPESRKVLLEDELLDHLECRIEAELAAGETPADAERNAIEALGDPEALRRSLERVEPAFELHLRTAATRGIFSAGVASVLFGVLGATLPRPDSVPGDLALASILGLLGFGVLWTLAPRGMGAAIAAEARASIEKRPRSPRRRAVLAYVWSLILFPYSMIPLSFLTDLINVDDVMTPFMHLWIPLAIYPLYLMWRARQDRDAVHGT
jgi:hypothetical protein